VFVQLPTGFGKSACFQVLPLVYDAIKHTSPGYHMVLVVAPLLVIMEDQVGFLTTCGISCCSWSQLPQEQWESEAQKAQVVFATPESLFAKEQAAESVPAENGGATAIPSSLPSTSTTSSVTGSRAKKGKIPAQRILKSSAFQNRCVALVVDEVHCIHKWGDEFRVEYSKLSTINAALGGKQIMALTATATQEILKTVRAKLVKEFVHIREDPSRPNLRLTVRPLTAANKMLNDLLLELQHQKGTFGRTVVFFHSFNLLGEAHRNAYDYLRPRGLLPFYASYHSLRKPKVLEKALEGMRKPENGIRLMFASSAFGMGVNIPGITRVWHIEAPHDVDDYVQQIGRAAREPGATALAILFSSRSALRRCSKSMQEFVNNTTICRHVFLKTFFEFPETVSNPAPLVSCCDVCHPDQEPPVAMEV